MGIVCPVIGEAPRLRNIVMEDILDMKILTEASHKPQLEHGPELGLGIGPGPGPGPGS